MTASAPVEAFVGTPASRPMIDAPSLPEDGPDAAMTTADSDDLRIKLEMLKQRFPNAPAAGLFDMEALHRVKLADV